MLTMVTIVSLVATAVCAAVAWRLIQEDRRRSDARVAALIASLDAELPLEAESAVAPAALDDVRADTPTEPVVPLALQDSPSPDELFANASRETPASASGLFAVGVVATVL